MNKPEAPSYANENIVDVSNRKLTKDDIVCTCYSEPDGLLDLRIMARELEITDIAARMYEGFLIEMGSSQLCVRAGLKAAALSAVTMIAAVSTGMLGIPFHRNAKGEERPLEEERKIAQGSVNMFDLFCELVRGHLDRTMKEIDQQMGMSEAERHGQTQQ